MRGGGVRIPRPKAHPMRFEAPESSAMPRINPSPRRCWRRRWRRRCGAPGAGNAVRASATRELDRTRRESSSCAGLADDSRPQGRGGKRIVILPGLLNNTEDYDPMATLLRNKYGHSVTTIKVARTDWLRNAVGVVTPEYWTGTLKPLPTVAWYLDRIDEALDTDAQEEGVVLIAHSAGGWLGRLWMDAYSGHTKVHTYISLGSPQLAAPEGSDAFDQTRGILTYINRKLPGAFHDNVQYVTVSGSWKKGAGRLQAGNFSDFFVGLTYKQTCGESEVDGDGITPVPIAHLEGSEKVNLAACYHSPVGADEGGGVREWYGSEKMLEQWEHYI